KKHPPHFPPARNSASSIASRKGAAHANRSAERLSCNSKSRLWFGRGAGIWFGSKEVAQTCSQNGSAVDHPGYRLGKDMRDRKDNRLCCHDKSGVLSGLARVVWS